MNGVLPTVDGVPATPRKNTKDVDIAPTSGISTLIVGAGVGGLVAALELTRKGHAVRLFEREKTIKSAGDFFSIGLSGRRWFSHWPEMSKELDRISLKGTTSEYHKHSGEMVISMAGHDFIKKAPPGGLPILMQMRPLFHAMLYRQVQKLGIDVVCDKRAVEYFDTGDKGVVVTADGERTEADLVIAADGIGSKAQTLILGEQVRGRYSGHTVFRSAYPTEIAFQDPTVKQKFSMIDGRPALRIFYGPDTHMLVLTTKDILCWGLDHKAAEGSSESWNKTIRTEDAFRKFDETPGWSELVKTLVRTTPPDTVVDYPLVFRNPQPKWASPGGRVMTLGDSAHTFLPTSGSGATQAIEDAVTIASCLQLSGKDKVSTAVRAYATMRFERVSNAQRLGFFNLQHMQGLDWEAAKKDPRTMFPKIPRWIFTHDPEQYAYENYDKVVASFTGDGAAFENTNVPTGSKYQPWTMDQLLDDIDHGRAVQLDGDWS